MGPLCVCAQFSSLQSPEKIQIIKFNIEERAKVEEEKCLVYVPALSDSRTTDSFFGLFWFGGFFSKPGGFKTSSLLYSFAQQAEKLFCSSSVLPTFKNSNSCFFISSHAFLKNNGRGAQYFAQP